MNKRNSSLALIIVLSWLALAFLAFKYTRSNTTIKEYHDISVTLDQVTGEGPILPGTSIPAYTALLAGSNPLEIESGLAMVDPRGDSTYFMINAIVKEAPVNEKRQISFTNNDVLYLAWFLNPSDESYMLLGELKNYKTNYIGIAGKTSKDVSTYNTVLISKEKTPRAKKPSNIIIKGVLREGGGIEATPEDGESDIITTL